VCANGVRTVHALPSLSIIVPSPSPLFDHLLSTVVRGSGSFVVWSHLSFIVRSFIIQSFVVQWIVISEVVGGVIKDEERWWERRC
jgi:hypothetical protein